MVKIDIADEYFSIYIRSRDNWTCQRCGKYHQPWINSKGRLGNPALHCSHFKGRGKEATRFEPLNCDALCYGCHKYFTAQPDEHTAWQKERKGEDIVDKLVLQSHSYKKKDRKLEAMIWKEAIKQL